MKRRRHTYIAPTVRDWSLAFWAITDALQKLRWRLGSFGVVLIVCTTISIYGLVVFFWKFLLAGIIIAAVVRFLAWQHRRNRPVPWDEDYDERHDNDIPF